MQSGPPRPPEDAVATPAGRRPRQPHLSGDLPSLLDGGPAFATAMRGYDRLQVDNYVAWAENELRVAQRVTRELVDRLATSEAEAHRARQLMSESARDRDLVRLSDRVVDLLRLAAAEAAASAEAATGEAAQARDVLAGAREEAEVIVRRARRLEARAAGRLLAAERRIAEARTAEEQARSRVQAMLQDAAEEHERLEAAAAARLTRLQREVAEVEQRRRRADEHLRRLTERVDAALAALGEAAPAEFTFRGNRAEPPAAPAGADRTVRLRRRSRRALSA